MNLITWFFILKLLTPLNALDLGLMKNFFSEKSTRNVVIFSCFPKSKQVAFAKALIGETRKISYLNMNRKGVENVLLNLYLHFGVILDGDCPNSAQFLQKCGQLKLFGSKYHWLITSSSINIMEKLENININIDTDMTVAVKNDSTIRRWDIYDVYNPAANHRGILNFTQIGQYYNESYQARIVQSKYWIRKNLTGVVFKTMVVLPIPFHGTLSDYLNSDNDRNINTFNRFHARLLHFCRDYYNFTMDISVVKSWGYTKPDGTFDGMVGALEKKIIDFGSSPLFLRADRAKVIDYGRNTWILRAAFIFRNPPSRTSIQIFLMPFSTTIWLITGAFACLSVIILKIVMTFERRNFRYLVETSWGLSVIFTLGAFCQQGSPATPRMLCGRITAISIFFLSMIIYQFYSASIVSNLLMKPTKTLKDLKDLLESPLKVGCEDILYNRDYFKRSTDKTTLELYHKKIRNKNSSNFLMPEKGLDLVQKGGYAFHVELATAYPIIEATFAEKPICQLVEIELFRTQPMHANYQKFSPFRDMLDTCLQRIAEFGILYRERNFWHPRKPECIQSSKSITFNVGLNEFYPALMVLLIGFICSLTILILEKQVILFRNQSVEKLVILPYVD